MLRVMADRDGWRERERESRESVQLVRLDDDKFVIEFIWIEDFKK